MARFFTRSIAITITLWLLISSILSISAITQDFSIREAPYDMVEISGFNESELKFAFEDTVHYLYDGRLKLDTQIDGENVFNQKEIKHMQEVKFIFQLLIWIWFILTLALIPALILFFKKIKHQLSTNWLRQFLKRYFFFVFIFLAAIGLGIAFFFEPLFITFHQIVFRNDDWLLSLSTDHLIQFLPEQFFLKRALQIAILFITLHTITTLFPLFFIRKKDNDA